MQINGRVIGFAYTVGAKKEVDALCAARGAENLKGLVSGTPEQQSEGMAGVILALSAWGEKLRAAEEPGYTPRPLTPEELELVTVADFNALFAEALEAMTRDSGRTVETAEQPQKKTGESAPSS